MAEVERTIVLVTGVGRAEGLGFEVCRQLAGRAMMVLLTARDLRKAGEMAARLVTEGDDGDMELDVRGFALDVSKPEDAKRVAGEVGAKWGRLDVLINNASGASPYGEPPSAADLTKAAQVMDTTLFGAWRVCQAFLPLLQRSKAGRIVNVSSGAGSHGDPVYGLRSSNPMGPGYALAKAALNALTSALARELAGTRVLVNAVCPGFTATYPGGAAQGARPVPEAAAGIVWAATLPAGGPSGGFFRDGKPLPW